MNRWHEVWAGNNMVDDCDTLDEAADLVRDIAGCNADAFEWLTVCACELKEEELNVRHLKMWHGDDLKALVEA